MVERPARSFSGRALIIEDDALIALDLQEMLERRGFGPVELAHTADTAEQRARHTFAVAIVDIKLASGTSLAAAHLLHGNGTPLVFTTGYDGALPPPFSEMPALTKPFDESRLDEALDLALKIRSPTR
jgi:ActR/RegA family two-component response regulator